MPWTLTINVADVNGSPVTAGTFWLTLWTGSGTPQNTAPQPFAAATIVTTVADEVVNVDVRLRHVYFNDCVVVLLRDKSSGATQWVGSASQVSQSGANVTVNAVLRRLRAAPQVSLTQAQIDDLNAKALAARTKQQHDATSAGKKTFPAFADLQSANGAQVQQSSGEVWSFSTPAPLSGLHLVSPDPLGDASKPGWGKFAFTTKDADPAHYGVYALLEYGEVSPLVAQAPRFLVACWIPSTLLQPKIDFVDFILWFTPTTDAVNYPADEYPFRKAYPYQVWAGGTPPKDVGFVQRYILLPALHMTRSQGVPTSHYLSYLAAAAGKSCAIVAPICPATSKNGYEAFMSQSGLMRLLQELCMQIALYRQDKAAQYPVPPQVGKIAVAALSAGVQRSQAVIGITSALAPYSDGHWQGDASQFRKQWKEFWSFDAAFSTIKDRDNKVVSTGGDQFRSFLNNCAGWVQQDDSRHLRIYKTQFTAGANSDSQWDPRLETSKSAPLFARMIKSASSPRIQESKKPWAVSISDSRRQWHCISLSEEYIRDPNGDNPNADLPEIPIGADEYKKKNPGSKDGDYKFYHDAIPRMFFGHALLTSGLT